MVSASVLEVTSPPMDTASPPACVMSCTVSCAVSALTSCATTLAPSCANKMIVARPIPVPAPVTKATLLASRMSYSHREITRIVSVNEIGSARSLSIGSVSSPADFHQGFAVDMTPFSLPPMSDDVHPDTRGLVLQPPDKSLSGVRRIGALPGGRIRTQARFAPPGRATGRPSPQLGRTVYPPSAKSALASGAGLHRCARQTSRYSETTYRRPHPHCQSHRAQ